MDGRQFMAGSLAGLSAAWAPGQGHGAQESSAEDFASLDASTRLPALPADKSLNSLPTDWLVTPFTQQTGVYRTAHKDEIAMTNGLIRRTWRLRPNAATVAVRQLPSSR